MLSGHDYEQGAENSGRFAFLRRPNPAASNPPQKTTADPHYVVQKPSTEKKNHGHGQGGANNGHHPAKARRSVEVPPRCRRSEEHRNPCSNRNQQEQRIETPAQPALNVFQASYLRNSTKLPANVCFTCVLVNTGEPNLRALVNHWRHMSVIPLIADGPTSHHYR